MTDINKNFGLAGVGSDVQYGKGGARVLYSGGVFQLVDPTATSLIRLQVANGSTSTDAISKGQLDLTTVGMQTEIDAAEAAVGLLSNGALPAWNSPIYIGNSITVVNAVEVLDHRMKTTVDSIAAIGNAFSYVGTVIGGASSGAAVDLSQLPTQTPGDYVKVSVSSYFKIGSSGTPFFVNANDGLVKNTTGGWDIIDNTNSTVVGTSGRIIVTGSSDTGFAVNLDPTFIGQNTITTTGTITTGTWRANTLATAFGGTGLTTYSTGDILVGSGTTLARLSMGSATQVLRVNASGTGLEYAAAADPNVGNVLLATQAGAGLASNGAYIANVAAHFTANATSLLNADNRLDTAIFNVATAAGLSGVFYSANGSAHYINTATSLAGADNLLDTKLFNVANSITVLQGATGLSGSYVANTNAHFIFGANSLISADNALDSALYNLTVTVNNLSPDQIISSDQKVSVKAQLTGVEISGNVNSTKTMLMDFRSSTVTNTTARMDFSQAGKVALKITSGNSDLVLAPSGTGVVDHYGTRLANVANGAADTDAVALGQANAIFSRYMTNVFSETNTIQPMGSVNGIVMRVIVIISSPFNSGAVVTIGYASNQLALAGTSDIDLSTAGVYVIDRVMQITQSINAYVSGATGIGSGRVIVEYLKV